MVKRLLVLFFILSSTNLFGQIKIAPVEFLWVKRVDSALNIIKTYDKSVYDTLTKYCTNIGFWNGKYSSIDGNSEILITKNDVLLGPINNLAAVIVHESKHLQYVNNNINVKIVELWLINNTEKEIKRFQGN
jgi:hypothetical protein